MRERLKILAYFAVFWLAFQVMIRAAFLLYNYDLSQQLSPGELFKVFLYGLKMDASISGYFLMLTGLFLTASVFTQSRYLFLILNAITLLLMFVSCAITIVDVELYRHWGFRLNTTPFFYIGPEAAGTVGGMLFFKLMLLLALLFGASVFFYRKWLSPQLMVIKPTEKKNVVPLLIVSCLMFIPIRGSFSVAPMNTGFVYFHKTKAYANHAAINVVWNFLYSVRKEANLTYPENLMDNARAEALFDSLYRYEEGDSTVPLLKSQRPNVILFILESFSADIIEPLGGLKDIAPNLNRLCSEGILFRNFYSSGDRTDKGLVSILSGYPAQPRTSIIKFPAKAQKLPYLNHAMQDLGYRTSFVYGGDIDFANFRSYLTNSRFDHITSIDDFDDEGHNNKWGVHDHIVFDRAAAECDTAQSPFFKVILSLSSHEPFDIPIPPLKEGNDHETLYLNACHYTDKCVGDFVEHARKQPWWENTVILFVADHGHRQPGNKELKSRERFRIPMLMIGGAIKKDTIIDTYAGHTDIANTLLAQLDQVRPEFKFSRNVLSPKAHSFALYFFNDGFGLVAPDRYIIYDNIGKQYLRQDGASPQDLELGQAYQQTLFIDYNRK